MDTVPLSFILFVQFNMVHKATAIMQKSITAYTLLPEANIVGENPIAIPDAIPAARSVKFITIPSNLSCSKKISMQIIRIIMLITKYWHIEYPPPPRILRIHQPIIWYFPCKRL